MDRKECAEFYQELQSLLTSRPVTPEEVMKYVQFMESANMEKAAFLMIVQYCVGIKGSNTLAPYISKTAQFFAQNGDLTVEQVQKALSKKSNSDNRQGESASSQEEYLIKLFRKLNPRLKNNVIDIVKGLTTSLDNK